MKKYLLFLLMELIVFSHTMAQIPTIVEDLAIYAGNDATVFNKVDGKFYKHNNLGQYEMYGVYEVVDFTTPQVTEVEYITNADNSDLFIGDYRIKHNTRVVAYVEVQNTANVPTGVFGSRENINGNLSNAFCFETVNASTLQAKLGNESQFTTNGMSYIGVKSVFDLNGLTGVSNVYVDGNTIASHTWTTWDNNYDYKYMLTFFGVRENNTNCYDFQPAGMKLYGAKIYEDTTLVMDLTPIVTITGKGGLKDRLSGTVYTNGNGIISASNSYNVASSNKGVSTYKGKLVYNTADKNMYRWNGFAWICQGRGLEDIDDELYYKLKNWSYPSSGYSNYDITFQGFKEDYGERTNHNEALTCQPYFEPLWYTIGGLETGAEYRIGFDFTTGGFSAYISNIYYLPFFVQDNNPINPNNSWGSDDRNNTDFQTLAFVRFPFPAQEEWHIGRNFTARDEDVTLILQFGSCDDYMPYKFWFDNIYIQKYLFPSSYPDISLDSPIEEVVDEADWTILQTVYAEMNNGEGWDRKWIFNSETRSLSGLYGVTLNEGRVTGVDLSSNGLTGTFPFALLTLPYLKTLDISGNLLTGDIGATMVAFKQKNPSKTLAIQKMNISDNRFSGNIGLFANCFANLNSLNASGNCLEDVFPMIPTTVTSLELGRQTISRVVPLHLSKLTLAELAMKVPTILIYDHASRSYSPNISLLGTTQDGDFSMSMVYRDGQMSMPYVSEQNTYYGESGDTLNVALLNADGTPEGSTFRISLGFDVGDGNCDGKVNVLDLQATLNYMFGEYKDRPYNFTASNLYKDEVINVQDVVLMVDKLLNADESSNIKRYERVRTYEGDVMEATDASLYWCDNELILNTKVGVTAADICFAGNASIIWNLQKKGFNTSEKKDADGIHAVIYSLSGAEIPVGETVIAQKTNGNANPISALLSDRHAAPVSVCLTASDVTAIARLKVGASDWTIFRTDGTVVAKGIGRVQLMSAQKHLTAGVYILQGSYNNTQKFTIK